MVNFIICELNPLHNGHHYLLNAVGEAPVVCVMSGHVTQRGAFACMDKWTRARAALSCGADLVLELPAGAACGSAMDFARGALAAANATGLDGRLCFGMEEDNLEILKELATFPEDQVQALTRKALDEGASPAAAMREAYKTLSPEHWTALDLPNNLLAFEYIKANTKFDLFALRRVGAAHDSGRPTGDFADASYLRRHLADYPRFTPSAVHPLYKSAIDEGAVLDPRRFDLMITSALRRKTRDEWLSLYPDGLGARLAEAFETKSLLTDVYDTAKSKCFTHSMIRRAVLRTYLDLPPFTGDLPYLRVLGLNDTGAALLRRMDPSVPLLIKPAAVKDLSGTARRAFDTDARVTDAFNFALRSPRAKGMEYRSPVVIK